MVKQIDNLGDKYNEWVHAPVFKYMRLHESDIWENLSKCSFNSFLIQWSLILLFEIYLGLSKHSFDKAVNFTESLSSL